MSQRSRSWFKLKSAIAVLLVFAVCVGSVDARTKHSRSKGRGKARTTRVSKPAPSQGTFNTVVIDAGHGGFDRGGIRRNIIPEKGVTLDVALRLERSLRNAGFKTVMTRRDDRFVSLARRVAIANAHPDAIFMCIHFNSAWRPGARGIETFYAAPAEAPLAIRIQRNLMTTTNGDNRGVKRASFYVLRRTRTRAVLAECGFLTNPQDAALASSASYRQRLADRISRAIVDYQNSL